MSATQNSYAQKLLKSVIKNEFAATAEDGILGGDIKWYVDSGSYVLNALISGSIYGGYPANNITALAGESGCGKTFFALTACKNFLDEDKENIVLYFESEGAIRVEMLDKWGIDKSRFIIFPVVTVEQYRKQVIDLVESYDTKKDPKVFVVLDSLGNLSTEKEVSDIVNDTGKRDMTRAALVKAAFRVITLKAAQKGIPLLLTNHTYTEIGSMYPKEIMSGGRGLVYTSSTIVYLSKSKDKDGSEQVGVKLRATVPKSRLTIENSKVLTQVNFRTGLNRYFGLVPLACEAGIIKKSGTRYEWTDGKTYYEKHINANPDKFFTKEILDKIDEYTKSSFTYQGGQSDEDLIDEVEELNVEQE